MKNINSPTLLERAEKIAAWMLANQPTDRLDSNKGRFLQNFDPERPDSKTLTTGWDTGCALSGLLALYKRTGKKPYLDSAELAGHYIMSLQVLDQRQKLFYGAFHEVTPQSMEFCPRDSTSAAWALLYLYDATGEKEYLERAAIFGDWMLEYGMFEGWPRWAVLMDGQDHFYAKGSFQSGVGAFFFDLFMRTHDPRYIERGMRPIAENYRKYFFREDGGVIVRRDAFDNSEYVFNDGSRSGAVEFEMHHFNDDFGNITLMRAAELFNDNSFREQALKFALFLLRNQDADGNFGGGRVPSAIPQALIYFHDLGEYYHNEELLAARERTLDALLKLQYTPNEATEIAGAFPDEGANRNGYSQRYCGMRCSMYALNALLHIESDQAEVWLGRANRKFRDPLMDIKNKPLIFKW